MIFKKAVTAFLETATCTVTNILIFLWWGSKRFCNWSMFIKVLMFICFPTALLMRWLTILHEERPALCWSCWSSQWIRRHLCAESRNQITAVINFSLCGYLIPLQTEWTLQFCSPGCLRHPWLEEKGLDRLILAPGILTVKFKKTIRHIEIVMK